MGQKFVSLHERAITLFLNQLRTVDELYFLALGNCPKLSVSAAYFRTEEDCRTGKPGNPDIILHIDCADAGHKAALVLLKAADLEAANNVGFYHLAFTLNGKVDCLYSTYLAIESR